MTIPQHGSDIPDPEFGKALTHAMENFANDPQPPVFDAPAMVGRARRRRRLVVGGAAAAVVVLGAGVAFGAQAARPGAGQVNAAAGAVATNTAPATPASSGTPSPGPSSTPASSGTPSAGPTSTPASSGTPSAASTPTSPAIAGSAVVPSVVGQSEATARQLLAAAGLQVGTVHDFTDWHMAAGLVISVQPAAGAAVPKGTAVDLFVSKGKP